MTIAQWVIVFVLLFWAPMLAAAIALIRRARRRRHSGR